MSTRLLVPVAISAICLIGSETSSADGTSDLDSAMPVVVRAPDGRLTKDSKHIAARIAEMATQQGHVTLWLTANTPFNPSVGELSPAEIAEQDRRVQAAFARILRPLIRSGVVWYPSSGPVIRGPGCLIQANSIGVRKLVRDKDILQIVSVD